MEVGEAVNHVSTPCNQTHSTMPSKGAWLHYVFPCGKYFAEITLRGLRLLTA